jgi:hypothetical protein
LTPRTVTVTSSSITTASPTRRVRINMGVTLLRKLGAHLAEAPSGAESEKP